MFDHSSESLHVYTTKTRWRSSHAVDESIAAKRTPWPVADSFIMAICSNSSWGKQPVRQA